MPLYIQDQIQVNSTYPGAVSGLRAVNARGKVIQMRNGSIDAGFAAFLTEAPGITYQTADIATQCTLAWIDGVALSGSGFVAYSRPVTLASVGTAGSEKLSAAAGAVIPGMITARMGAEASAQVSVVPVSSDGTAAPWTVEASSAALVTNTVPASTYTLGSAKINGTLISANLVELSIDPGISFHVEFWNGKAYPQAVVVDSRMPRMRLVLNKPASWHTWDLGAITTMTAWLRRVPAQGLPAADNDTGHIAFTAAGGVFQVTEAELNGGRLVIEADLTKPSTSSILSFGTGAIA